MNDLKGLKIHKLNNNNIRCIEIPRNLLKQINDIDLINNSGIYFLHNLNSDSFYIGQTDNLLKRFLDHNKKKEFEKIIAFTVETNDWSRTYIDYLEWYYINEIKKQNFWSLTNDQTRDKKPNISQFEEPILLDLTNNIDILLFASEIMFSSQKKIKKEHIFSLSNAHLIYIDGKYKMLEGSKIPDICATLEKTSKENTHYNTQIKKLSDMQYSQQKWLEDGIVEKCDDNYYILKKDILFSSSSNAACYARGLATMNGWTEWKNDNRESLDDVYRK